MTDFEAKIQHDVEVAPLTTLKLGGRARHFVAAQTEDDVAAALAFADHQGERVWILGGGSNVVVPDRGLDGLLLWIGLRGVDFEERGDVCHVSAAAGESWDDLVRACVERGLVGIECLSGIPGSVGATPIQNVGAYGQEVQNTLLELRAFDRRRREFVVLDNDACEFSYRDSRFKSKEPERFVVTRVTFALRCSGAPAIAYPELARALDASGGDLTLAHVRRTVVALRRSKSMVLDPADPNGRSCGSFFLNPIVEPSVAEAVFARFADLAVPRFPQSDGRIKLSAAWLIEHCGFPKGTSAGNVGISSRHALALVCTDGATSAELLAFAERVRAGVRERVGLELQAEPCLW